MNTTKLRDKDLEWADYALISAMSIQRKSATDVIARCREANVKTIAGGPLFTTDYEDFVDVVDHLVLNEAEATLPRFLKDLEAGHAEKMYTSDEYVNLQKTPLPLWELVDMKKYASMNLQYSRGCPFDCEFCDISVLFGRRVRTKTRDQVLAELDSLYSRKYRGDVFFVDDNFIGNRSKLKNDILPAIIAWNEAKGRPFSFQTEATIDLSDDEELIQLMVRAGFSSVFIGIETTNEDSLSECNKLQNKNRDLLACVSKIHKLGLRVMAGFILGFDNDPPSIFERTSAFIQNSGIASAMIGLLNAPRHTKLYQRLAKEGRLLGEETGDHMDLAINFIPAMDYDTLIQGYKAVVRRIYSPPAYYQRLKKFLREFKPLQIKAPRLRISSLKISYLQALPRSVLLLGIIGKERLHYWNLIFWTLFRRPRLVPLAVTLAIHGFHFRRFSESYL